VIIAKKVLNPDSTTRTDIHSLPLPRIAIFRNEIDVSYFPYSEAIAVDDSVDVAGYEIPDNIDILNLNDTLQIIEWIKQNAKAV